MVNFDNKIKILIAVNVILLTILTGLYFTMSTDSPHRYFKPSEDVAASIQDAFDTMITATLGESAPKFAVYFIRPKIDDEPLLFQSRPMRPASMIKVFIMAKAMSDVKNGMLSLDELLVITPQNIVGGAGSIAGEGVGAQIPARRLIELMIVESDNTATNLVIDRLGMDNINQYLRDNGYVDTIINHKMMLEDGKSTNLTSVRDLGTLFTRIYNHECVDDFYDRLMVDYLLKQEDRDCFPEALPLWNIAHKTGEIEGLYDDGGIFYGSSGDFVLVIMNDGIENLGETIDAMRAIALQLANDFMTATKN